MMNKNFRAIVVTLGLAGFFSAATPVAAAQVAPDAQVENLALSAPAEPPTLHISAAPELEPAQGAEPAQDAEPAVRTADEVIDNPVNAIGQMVQAFRTSNWRYVAAIVLSFLMFLGRRYRRKIKFFRGDRGGIVAVFALSTVGALVTSFFGNTPIDLKMFYVALEIGFYAMGGFMGAKKLLWPEEKSPLPRAAASRV